MAKYPSNPLLHLALLCVFAAAPINCQLSVICRDLVLPRGYSCQDHQATTGDGYILGLQRIGPLGLPNPVGRPPVLLQHGISMDAATWMLGTKLTALAFILVDQGFDVWTSNYRGTRSSRGHRTLKNLTPAYWDWSWDQLAAFDIPANFDYVFKKTGQKVHFVGHSLGTTAMIGALVLKKVPLTQIRTVSLLSPVAYLGKCTTPLARTSAVTFAAEGLYSLGVRQMPPPTQDAQNKLVGFLCSQPLVDCSIGLVSFTGINCCLSPIASKLFFKNTPEPTSVKNAIHLSQLIRNGKYQMFDYGLPPVNMAKYGRPTPPQYNIADIPKDLPLFFGYGGRDALCALPDVDHLLSDLKGHNPTKLVKNFIREYAHMDFIMAWNARQKVYDPMIKFFKSN